MTDSQLAENAVLVLQAPAWLCAGMLLGALHFLLLRWNVRMLVFGRGPLLAVALPLGRFALVGVVLAVIASRFGAWPLLVTAAGILAARTAAVRLAG